MEEEERTKISVVIPAKDEEGTIGKVLVDLNKTIKKLSQYTWEVIVVTDHCLDATAALAQKYGAHVIENPRSSGKGHALSEGFNIASGDIIITMDADYSHRPEDIPLFINAFSQQNSQQDIGLVIGSRFTGGSDEYTMIRAVGNEILTTILNLLFRTKITDSLNGYKAIRKDIVKKHPCSCKAFEIEIELIYNTLLEGKKIIEVPSHERERASGEMKSHAVIHGTRFLLCILEKGLQYQFKKLFE